MFNFPRVICIWSATVLVVISCGLTLAQDAPVPMPVAIDTAAEYLDAVESHFDRLILYSTDRYGRTRSGMWVASIDIETNELLAPQQQETEDRRYLPGAQFYWDQPMLLAAYELGKRSGCKCYPDAADVYIRSYLHLSGKQGDLQPNQTTFFNVRTDQIEVMEDRKQQLVDHTPAWELIWKNNPLAVHRMIRSQTDTLQAQALLNIRNPSTTETAFAINSLTWMMHHDKDKKGELTDQALELAELCSERRFDGRSKTPTVKLSTDFALEISLIKAWHQTGDERFRTAATAFNNGFLQVLDASADLPTQEPAGPADLAKADMQQAEAYLTLYKATGDKSYVDSIACIADALATLNSTNNKNIEAQHFGRAIHFLARASELLDRPEYYDTAYEIGDLAIEQLFVKETGMFRSRIGSDRCDAADGLGWLLLALLYLDGDDATAGSALKF